jgi:hypothetical protein
LKQTRDELEGGLQHRRAGPLGADQGASDVEAFLRQQLVEVVARHPPGQFLHRRVTGPDVVGVAVAQIAQLGVDLALAAASGDNLVEVLFLVDPDPEPGTVVGQYLQRFGVVRSTRSGAIERRLDGVDAAGIVADIAADRAPGVRGGIRAEDQPVLGGGPVELLVDHPGFCGDQLAGNLDFPDPGEVLGEVDDHRDVDRLARQAGTTAAG